jgi:ATP-binding protein involved in chromosome partitioning
MIVTKTQVFAKLRTIRGPDGEGNIVDLGLVSEPVIKDGHVTFAITVPAEQAHALEAMREAAEAAVGSIAGVSGTSAVLTAEIDGETNGAAQGGAASSPGAASRASGHPAASGLPGIKHLVAVVSGKGGVGKSTTAVNLALGFKAMGLSVGIFDADIYGPSQPRLLGLTSQSPLVAEDQRRLIPFEAYGIRVMSMGFLVDEGMPVIWRGPMVVQALQQMLYDVAWDRGGELDVLVIDMPPGTGDVQLTMAQQTPLSGAVIVSTPQDLALIDARKGLDMFRKVDVPVLGLIENMSYFLCPKCGERSEIFGHGGAEREAKKLGLSFLGAVPLHMEIRERSDDGRPITATAPDSPQAAIFKDIAVRTWSAVQAAKGVDIPVLHVSPQRDSLKVTFSDGFSYELPAEMLRVMSPSAEVQGHSDEQRVVVPGKRNVKITQMHPVGKYAAKIVFDDGHDTGLYTWSYLHDLGREKDARWGNYLAELSAKGLTRD